MAELTIIIPARNEPFLNQTIDDLFANATGDVEVMVMLDGVMPDEPPSPRPNLSLIYQSEPRGIGYAVNALARISTAPYIMKTDAHCAFAKGFDQALISHCEPDYLLVPARYQLKDETWSRGYGPIHYLTLTYPWLLEPQFGWGLHGKKWRGESGLDGGYFWPEKAWADRYPLDDIMAFQGSCWFMRRDYYLSLGGIDPRYFLYQESQDIGFKVWMSGGRVARDKSTWYAHLHKGNRHGRGYFINKQRGEATNRYSADFWMNDKWDGIIPGRGIKRWVEHFWPIPGWPEDWDDPRYQREFEEKL